MSGLDVHTAKRVQRALFVHSVGFYEIIVEACKSCKDKKTTIVNLWKTFQMLLELCCKTDHQMLLIEVANDFDKELELKTAKFVEANKDWDRKEGILNKNIRLLQRNLGQAYDQVTSFEQQVGLLND